MRELRVVQKLQRKGRVWPHTLAQPSPHQANTLPLPDPRPEDKRRFCLLQRSQRFQQENPPLRDGALNANPPRTCKWAVSSRYFLMVCW